MAGLVGGGGPGGDVIVAPATPPGVSAVAVVRLSGPPGETLAVARRLAPGLPEAPAPARARRCRLVDAAGEALDDALVIVFPAPRSSTGEEVVELQCHGSPAVVAGLLAAARAGGARLATPGEFTRRALANGKVDLVAAEGLGNLMRADSRGAARRALGLVEGELSRRLRTVREELLDVLAGVEAGLDFPEEVEEPCAGGVVLRVAEELERIERTARPLDAGAAVPVVAIVGRPNAGKSTLFNALVGSDRAIVTPVAGTTRDAVSEEIEVAGERVRLVDTAGLREAGDEVERLGIEVTRRVMAGADLVLLVEDGTGPVPEEPQETVLVRTKSDLRGLRAGREDDGVAVAARIGAGIDELRTVLVERLGLAARGEGLFLLERHRDAIGRAARELAVGAVEGGVGSELLAGGVRRALACLGEVTGETATEELLDRIFSRFCLGK